MVLTFFYIIGFFSFNSNLVSEKKAAPATATVQGRAPHSFAFGTQRTFAFFSKERAFFLKERIFFFYPKKLLIES